MPERGAPPTFTPSNAASCGRSARSARRCVDDYLELINPLWSTRELRGRVEEIKLETEDAATVMIRPG